MTEPFKNRLTKLLQQDWRFHWDRLCRRRLALKYVPVGGLRGSHKPKLSAAWQNGSVKWILCQGRHRPGGVALEMKVSCQT